MDQIRGPAEKHTDRSEDTNYKGRNFQESLLEADRQQNRHVIETQSLTRALQRAKIRVWFWSEETRLTHYMPAAVDVENVSHTIAGCEASDEVPVSELALLERVHPDDREHVAATWDRARTEPNHRAYDIVYRILPAGEPVCHNHETATPEFDEVGRFLGLVGVTQDISEQMLLREELKRSANRLDQTERVANIGHWKWDAERRWLISCSEQAAAIFGVSADEFLICSDSHNAYMRLVFQDDKEFVEQALNEFYRKCREERESSQPLEIEYRVVRRDGAVRHIRERIDLANNDNDISIRSSGTVQDITALKRAETEVRTRDAWLRTILDNAPIEIVLKDTDGRFMATSRSVKELHGCNQEEVVGSTTLDFLPPSIAEIYMAADRRVVETGEPLQQEIREDLAGKVRYSLSAKFPMKDAQGKVNGVCSLTSDISELKEAEARLSRAQKLEAAGKLTGGVAHDFNNLLAVIQGNAEMLSMEFGYQHPMVKDIIRASKRGAELTDRLLAYSRQQKLLPRPTDLVRMVGNMTDLLKRTLGETIEVETVTKGDLATVMVDPGKVEDAILNLALNARDAMPQGGKLTIQCQNVRLDGDTLAQIPEPVSGDYVVLAVSDSGLGMPAEVRAQAFEPFFTTKEVGKGSGLGLSMVHGFANQSGGHVEIDSEEGSGTTVSIYFPRSDVEIPREKAEHENSVPLGSYETILVIEDDSAVRTLVVRLLKGLGYRTIDAINADSAAAILEQGLAPDLVISDVVLPGGTNGWDFAKAVRARHPGLNFVFMSGYPADTPNGKLNPDTDQVILGKPFRTEELATAVRDALNR